MANNYLKDLRAVAEEREQFNQRTRRLHEERGVPFHVPIPASESDAEMMEYMRQGLALMERERALYEKYHAPGVDPHAVED